MTRHTRSAREVVELYNFVVWNQRDFALADELFANEVRRHGVDEIVTLTREQARQRVEQASAGARNIGFTLPIIVAGDDDQHVAIVYQAEITGHDGELDAVASIEVFRVIDGRITDVWNNTHQRGRWR